MTEAADIIVVGGGAAGMMAAIWAARSARGCRIVVLDSARRVGAKILVAGGGRCNVTHQHVDETAFAGSTGPAIRKVLGRFDVPRTIDFFRDCGVELKQEPTGKLFPVTDSARTVLLALLAALRGSGAGLVESCRVGRVRRDADGFLIETGSGAWRSQRLVLATGGMSLPKTGSDGSGYGLARSLGHTVTDRVFPALVPLTLPAGHFITALRGVSVPAALEVRSGSGRVLASFTGPVLCTHFGLSGPAVLDISRYYLDAVTDDPAAQLTINWLPSVAEADLDAALRSLGRATVSGFLRRHVPERLAEALIGHAGVDPAVTGARLDREARRSLVRAITAMPLPITGSRGFAAAEVTAGGVPLAELRLGSMESRCCPGLHLCGELCDVDGRIGGFNFQWAWASGYVAGTAAALAISEASHFHAERSPNPVGGERAGP
jgi:hypothetical protein